MAGPRVVRRLKGQTVAATKPNNPGYFVKGQKKPNQGKRGPNKTTVMAREAIAAFVDANAAKLQEWLDQIAADPKHGPKVAFDSLMTVVEYHVPKLARVEQTGLEGGPIQSKVTVEFVSKSA